MLKVTIIFLFSHLLYVQSTFPVVVLHGINDSCQGWMNDLSNFLATSLNVYSSCIESGANDRSIFQSIAKQSKLACELIKANDNYKEGFNIVAVSQGSLIARYIIEKCDMQGQVKTYASIGGPQMGIAKIPCDYVHFLCNLEEDAAETIIYSKMIQKLVAPADYFRVTRKYKTYLDKTFLAEINNEKTKNMTYYEKFSSLNQVLLIKFTLDKTIYPKESEWFEYLDEKDNLVSLYDSPFYKDDYIGLRYLNENGRVRFIEWEHEHAKFTLNDVKRDILPYLT